MGYLCFQPGGIPVRGRAAACPLLSAAPGPPLRLHHPAGRGRDVTAASSPPAASARRASLKRPARPAPAPAARDPLPPVTGRPRLREEPRPRARGALAAESPVLHGKMLKFSFTTVSVSVKTTVQTLPWPERDFSFRFKNK